MSLQIQAQLMLQSNVWCHVRIGPFRKTNAHNLGFGCMITVALKFLRESILINDFRENEVSIYSNTSVSNLRFQEDPCSYRSIRQVRNDHQVRRYSICITRKSLLGYSYQYLWCTFGCSSTLAASDSEKTRNKHVQVFL